MKVAYCKTVVKTSPYLQNTVRLSQSSRLVVKIAKASYIHHHYARLVKKLAEIVSPLMKIVDRRMNEAYPSANTVMTMAKDTNKRSTENHGYEASGKLTQTD